MAKTTSMSASECRALPVTVDVVTAGRALGLSRDHSYDLVKAGDFPVPVIRVGRRWIVPRAGLLKALGIEDAAA